MNLQFSCFVTLFLTARLRKNGMLLLLLPEEDKAELVVGSSIKDALSLRKK